MTKYNVLIGEWDHKKSNFIQLGSLGFKTDGELIEYLTRTTKIPITTPEEILDLLHTETRHKNLSDKQGDTFRIVKTEQEKFE